MSDVPQSSDPCTCLIGLLIDRTQQQQMFGLAGVGTGGVAGAFSEQVLLNECVAGMAG